MFPIACAAPVIVCAFAASCWHIGAPLRVQRASSPPSTQGCTNRRARLVGRAFLALVARPSARQSLTTLHAILRQGAGARGLLVLLQAVTGLVRAVIFA